MQFHEVQLSESGARTTGAMSETFLFPNFTRPGMV